MIGLGSDKNKLFWKVREIELWFLTPCKKGWVIFWPFQTIAWKILWPTFFWPHTKGGEGVIVSKKVIWPRAPSIVSACISQSSLIKLDYFHQYLETIDGVLISPFKFISGKKIGQRKRRKRRRRRRRRRRKIFHHGRTNKRTTTRKDRATQPIEARWLRWGILWLINCQYQKVDVFQ